MHPDGFLVLGCGSIGKRHIRNLRTLGVREIAAFDPIEARRREAEKEFGVSAVGTLAEAWARRPRVALVTSSTRRHVPLALEAARRGCHLFIEKPLSDSETGLQALTDLVKRKRLVTLVGCNMRFHPGLRLVKSLLKRNAIGRVTSVMAESGEYLPDWHPWENYRQGYSARQELGGGVILDFIHELDYVRWLAGPIVQVSCMAGKLSGLEINTEDTAAILLRFASGAIGEVHMDYVQRAYSRNCQVIGESGTLRWDYVSSEVRYYSVARKKWKTIWENPRWEKNQMYVDEMRHFLKCLDRREKSEQDIFEAARVLRVALAAKTSQASGRAVRVK